MHMAALREFIWEARKIVLMVLLVHSAVANLNIISISLRFVLGTSYVPAIEVGLKQYSRQFPDVFANYSYTRKYIREISESTCGAVGRQNVFDVLTELYSLGELQKPNTILIAPSTR